LFHFSGSAIGYVVTIVGAVSPSKVFSRQHQVAFLTNPTVSISSNTTIRMEC